MLYIRNVNDVYSNIKDEMYQEFVPYYNSIINDCIKYYNEWISDIFRKIGERKGEKIKEDNIKHNCISNYKSTIKIENIYSHRVMDKYLKITGFEHIRQNSSHRIYSNGDGICCTTT